LLYALFIASDWSFPMHDQIKSHARTLCLVQPAVMTTRE
jgi:hypothetical protein